MESDGRVERLITNGVIDDGVVLCWRCRDDTRTSAPYPAQ